MVQACDHTSVGILVYHGRNLLLIERRNPPFGFAPPAGHVDQHGSFENAATVELKEEVGLVARQLRFVIEGRKDNKCRRFDGTWHYWRIYRADAVGNVSVSKTEVRSFGWYSPTELRGLAVQTEHYLSGDIVEEAWRRSPGLEIVWLDWFRDLGLI